MQSNNLRNRSCDWIIVAEAGGALRRRGARHSRKLPNKARAERNMAFCEGGSWTGGVGGEGGEGERLPPKFFLASPHTHTHTRGL